MKSLEQLKQNFFPSIMIVTMTERNRTPTRQFVEVGDAHVSAESASDVGDKLQPQLLERKLSPSEVDRRIKSMIATLAMQLETLIQSVTKLSERSSNRSTEGNVASEQSRSSGQYCDSKLITRFFYHHAYYLPVSIIITRKNKTKSFKEKKLRNHKINKSIT